MTHDPAPTPLSPQPAWKVGLKHAPESSEASRSSHASSYDDSRSSTPDSAAPLQVNFKNADIDRNWNEKPENVAAAHAALGVDDGTALLVGAAGRQPEEVYTRTLSWWRAGIRRAILRNVECESRWLADMQALVRHPVLDAYFVYTSSLGTHTFFMVMLPIFYFFGAPEFGRGLLVMLAVGVYVSSFLKDLCCAPRPFAPPVTRLTIGSHHLEYGFPSTHSTNSVSIALFFYHLIRRAYVPASSVAKSAVDAAASSVNATSGILPSAETIVYAEGLISRTTYQLAVAALVFYVFSIIFGRLYTGMHSFTDCVFGVAIGAGLWGIHKCFGSYVDAWIRDNGLIVPAVIIPLCLYLVHRHPQPVDDCPCFEDAIAFVSVVMGEFIVRWYMLHNGYDEDFFTRAMPGSSWATWSDIGTWWSTATIKMVMGILGIFIWRIVAKSFCHFVLPPTFRFLSHLFTLPHRRFYTPATDYTTMPPDKGLRPIPSFIDLPGMVEYEVDGVGVSAAVRKTGTYGAIKQRNGNGKARQEMFEKNAKGGRDPQWWAEPAEKERDVKHYDADVLTKVFVYSGIGVVACGLVPIMFEVLGWGVKTS